MGLDKNGDSGMDSKYVWENLINKFDSEMCRLSWKKKLRSMSWHEHLTGASS